MKIKIPSLNGECSHGSTTFSKKVKSIMSSPWDNIAWSSGALLSAPAVSSSKHPEGAPAPAVSSSAAQKASDHDSLLQITASAREDIILGAKYVLFRERLFSKVLTELKSAQKSLSRRDFENFRYELVNIFARFYMSVRNEDIPYIRSFRKMLAELVEKVGRRRSWWKR